MSQLQQRILDIFSGLALTFCGQFTIETIALATIRFRWFTVPEK